MMQGAAAGGWMLPAQGPRVLSQGNPAPAHGDAPPSRAAFRAIWEGLGNAHPGQEGTAQGADAAAPEPEATETIRQDPEPEPVSEGGMAPAEDALAALQGDRPSWPGAAPDPSARPSVDAEGLASSAEIPDDGAVPHPLDPVGSPGTEPNRIVAGAGNRADPGMPMSESEAPTRALPPDPGRPALVGEAGLAGSTRVHGPAFAAAETAHGSAVQDPQQPRRSRNDETAEASPRDDPGRAGPTSPTEIRMPAAAERPQIAFPAIAAEAVAEAMRKTPGSPGDRAKLDLPLFGTVEHSGRIVQENLPATGGEARTAQSAARQIAIAVSRAADGRSEVSLSPAELGRVRFGLQVIEGVVTVHIQTERPETMDLLRRHVDGLLQEFREQGFDDATFTFAQDRQPPRNPAPAEAPAPAALVTVADNANRITLVPASGQLDLRL